MHVEDEINKSVSQEGENEQIFTIDQESLMNNSIAEGGNMKVTITRHNTLPLEYNTDDNMQSY